MPLHGCAFVAVNLPRCIRSDKNPFIKLTVAFNAIGNNEINL